MVCVCGLCQRLREPEKKKKKRLESPGNGITPKKKYWIEKNNKERLNNNILIKIEFFDARGIVKWYGISNKVAFRDGKKKQDGIL